MRSLAPVHRYLLKYKWLFITGAVFVGLANVFQVYAPGFIGDMIDTVSVNADELKENKDAALAQSVFRQLLIYALLFMAFTGIRAVFMFFMRQTIIVMSRRVEFDQKNELFQHYERLTPAFFKRNNTGDLMSRVAEDVGRVRQYVGPAIMYFLNLVFNFIFAIWMMLSINPTLTAYVLIPLPLLSISIYFVNSIINRRSEHIQAQLSTLTSIAQESFSGIRVIQAYAREKTTVAFFDKECDDYKEKSLSLARVDAMFQPLMVLLIGASVLLTIFVGGWQVIEGKLSPGNLAEFIFYVNMLTWPVTSLGWVVSIIQRAAASQKRITEFLEIKPDIENEDYPSHQPAGSIRFEHVSFTYTDTGVEALRDVSFQLKKGEKMAIIGRTGSGKSTIADLLFRLYDPTEGVIYFDEIPASRIPLHDLRKGVSAVPQDVFLFSDTIHNNIAFGNPHATREQVEQCAKYASVHDEIMRFPNGYETVVGERGVTLSGGQKQRISMARAFLKDSPVIILDDALSAVDADTEHTIIGNMRQYLEDKTAIIITHRVFNLMQFDRIIVLHEHAIAEQGTHAELMAGKGLYYNLFLSQEKASETKLV